jgi:AraC-like DNA-binding protein
MRNLPDPLALVDRALAAADWDAAALGGVVAPPPLPGEPRARRLPFPRLAIVLEGRKDHVLSAGGARRALQARAGQVVHFATSAWEVDRWEAPCRFLGLVFRPYCLRVIEVRFAGGAAPGRETAAAHHTRRPLGGAGATVLAALDRLAAEPGAPGAPQLAQALTLLARAHLAADLAGAADAGARRTWHRALELLEDRLERPPARAELARTLGLHPNYLSALFTACGGASFRRTLEDLRLERARMLLAAEPELGVAAVAARCGWTDPGHFARVFRRRTGCSPRRFARSG